MIYTVLLVEDNPADILLYQRAFRNENYSHVSLQIVTDGDAAIFYLSGGGEYADRTTYPLPVIILLDLKLPHRSGYEVLAWIKEQPQLKRLPVIVMTSSKQQADVNKTYDLGVNSYLVKPDDFTTMSDLLHSITDYWLKHNKPPEIEKN
jgi:CheY-like chemotaxis protein